MSKEEKPPEETTEDEDEGKTGKTTKIKVQVSRDPEIEALRAEKEKAEQELEVTKAAKKKGEDDAAAEKQRLLDEKTAIEKERDEKAAILQQQALAEFEKEKTGIMEMIKDSKLTEDQKAEIEEKLQSPKNLEIVKSLIGMMAAAIKEPPVTEGKKPPTGKAPFIPPADAETFEDKVAMVDELYRRAYYQPQLYTKQQVEEAKTKIDTLFRSLIGSKSWTQLREGQNLPLPQIMSCPHCGRTYVGELPTSCGTCGFNFKKTGDYQKLR